MEKRSPSSGPTGPVLARLDRPRVDQRTDLAIVADPHLTPTLAGTWKVFHRTASRFRKAVADVNDSRIDHTVFVGDLTADGRPAEFDLFDRLVDPLETPWTALPGNHDVPKAADDHESPTPATFADRYAGETYPFVRRIGGIDAVFLHTATVPNGSLRKTWGGRISDRQIEWLERTLPKTTTPVVFLHHNLRALPELPDAPPWTNFPIDNGERVVDVLSENHVALAISGHHHVPAVTRGAGPTEVIAPGVGSFPPGYLTVELSSDGTTVRFVPLGTADEMQEAYWSSINGEATARGLVELATDRLTNFPLVDDGSGDRGDG